MLSTADILLALKFGTGLLLVLVLYHLLFVVVDLRKIIRRVDHVTREVEDVIMKPVSMADSIVVWLKQVLEYAQQSSEKKSGKKKLKSGKKK